VRGRGKIDPDADRETLALQASPAACRPCR
jgi:hypothetical protein